MDMYVYMYRYIYINMYKYNPVMIVNIVNDKQELRVLFW